MKEVYYILQSVVEQSNHMENMKHLMDKEKTVCVNNKNQKGNLNLRRSSTPDAVPRIPRIPRIQRIPRCLGRYTAYLKSAVVNQETLVTSVVLAFLPGHINLFIIILFSEMYFQIYTLYSLNIVSQTIEMASQGGHTLSGTFFICLETFLFACRHMK